MMHKNAAEWDEKTPSKQPKGRPCDWCGERVTSGFIHDDCLEKEWVFYTGLVIDGI